VNPVFTETQIGYLHSRQRARYLLVFDPCAVVFRARVAAVPDAPGGTYLDIEYNSVSVGDYADVQEGMTYIVSATADHMAPLSRGFVADTPTSSVLPINESSYPLSTDYYITVLRTYEVHQRVRQGALVGGHTTFQRNPPTITGVPSVSFKESSTTETFTLTAVGQATEDGESIDSYAWSVPDLGETSSTDTLTVDVPPDTHVWGWVDVTDTLGTTQRLNFRLINRPRFGSTLPSAICDNPRITRNWGGHHAAIRAYKGVDVTNLLNGCACVIVSTVMLDAGTVDLDPVVFVGYLTKESNASQSLTDKSVSFDLASAWELAAQRPMHQIAIRHSATPSVWDDLKYPTPQRVVTHILSRYSTVLNVCGLNLDDTGNTWFSDDANVNDTSLGDAIDFVLSEIKAEITSAASGELYLRRDLRYTSTAVRDAADVVWTLTNTDIGGLDYTARHDEKTGRVIIGFRTFYTSGSPSKGGKALAPAVILGTSPETQTRPNQLMPADLTETQLKEAAAERVGNILAAENSPYDLSGPVRPQLQYLNPNNFQWISLSLTSSVMARGRAVTERALLASLEIDYDVRAQRVAVNLQLIPETQGGAALIVAMLTPNAASLTGVITPPMGAYGGSYPTPSTINGTTDRPFSRRDMSGMAPPMPADQAANEGRRQVQGNSRTFAISFANPSAVGAGFTSVNSATYTITASGSAKVRESTQNVSLNTQTCGFSGAASGVSVVSGQEYALTATGTFTYTPGGPDTGPEGAAGTLPDCIIPTAPIVCLIAKIGAAGSWFEVGASLTFTAPTSGELYFTVNENTTLPGAFADNSVGPLLIAITDSGDADEYADPFWSWNQGTDDKEGQEINVGYLGATRGLMINGAPVAVPPDYNQAHEYRFEWTGDGNIPQFLFADTDYTDNENRLLYITIEGPGAGS
jgi:hypothetical protein